VFKNFDVEFDTHEPGQVTTRRPRKLSQILRRTLDGDTPRIPFTQTWLQFEGSPWAMFQEIQSPPWYVLQIDTRRANDVDLLTNYTSRKVNEEGILWNTALSQFDSQVALMYYRNPASNRDYDDWTSLPTRVITDADIVEEVVSRSIEEVATRWR